MSQFSPLLIHCLSYLSRAVTKIHFAIRLGSFGLRSMMLPSPILPLPIKIVLFSLTNSSRTRTPGYVSPKIPGICSDKISGFDIECLFQYKDAENQLVAGFEHLLNIFDAHNYSPNKHQSQPQIQAITVAIKTISSRRKFNFDQWDNHRLIQGDG